jgi:hypothetical protein
MRTSEVLTRLTAEAEERLSVGWILSGLGDRSFSILVVLLGLPNCIPMPPPIPLICAFLLIAVGLQMLIGLRAPWLPSYVLNRSVARSDFERASQKALPWLQKLERYTRPRLQWFSNGAAELAVGLLLIALAVGLILAAPFIGQIPWGIAVCLVGLGLVERDGVLILWAVVCGIVGAFLSAGFVYAVFVAIKSWFF